MGKRQAEQPGGSFMILYAAYDLRPLAVEGMQRQSRCPRGTFTNLSVLLQKLLNKSLPLRLRVLAHRVEHALYAITLPSDCLQSFDWK